MLRVVCLLIGYLLGSFQTAYFYGKAKGIDIREHGSGNAGTTNSLRVMGKRAGVLVLFGDVLKCILAMLLVRVLFGQSQAELMPTLLIYTGVGAVLGHDFPFYLKFKGGKGVAVSMGMIIGFHPALLPLPLGVFIVLFFITHYVSFSALTGYTIFCVEMIVLGLLGYISGSYTELLEIYGLVVFLTVLVYIQHLPNIRRLLRHEERKTYIHSNNKEESS